MISKQYIVPSLQALDAAYNGAATADDAQRFSKLAIIELCGWIEESIDEIVISCSDRNLKEQRNKDFYAERVVGCVYGFDYNKNIRGMLIHLIGLIGVEALEASVDQPTHETMKSTLGSLKRSRDSMAHTHLKGIVTIDAPSVTMRSFQRVYEGLSNLDNTIRSLGW